jgi:thiol-disulfide isomerase/thioredoxin
MWMQRSWSAAFLLFLATACGGPAARPGAARTAPADPLRAIRVTDIQGGHPSLPGLGGEVLVVALWATWCEPCLDELPRIDQMRQQYAGDPRVAIVAVNVDDEPAVASAAVARMGLTLPSYRGGEALMRQLAPRGADGKARPGLPLVAVLDWRARPARVHRRFGFEPGGASIDELARVIETVRRGGELPAEKLLLAAEPESPMVLALPRMNEVERRRHLVELRAQLLEMFPRFTAPQLDRVMERAAEISVEGGNLLISVPADIPLRGRAGGGGPIPFY